MIRFKDLKDVYLIGEIGINHNGDLQIAKKLIDAVYACGWKCVKFQKRNPDVCVPESQKNTKRDTPWGMMTYRIQKTNGVRQERNTIISTNIVGKTTN